MKVCDICRKEADLDLKWYGSTPECREKREELVGHFCKLHLMEIEVFIAKEKKVWETTK